MPGPRNVATLSVFVLVCLQIGAEVCAADARAANSLPGTAQADPAPTAVTDPAEADEDFAWQGEYASADTKGGAADWGLQVVALGSGRFDAALLRGGLPGAGWDGRTRIQLNGQRATEWLDLEGGNYRVRVVPNEARVTLDADGEAVILPKVSRSSPTEGAMAPAGAIVLFDGSSLDQLDGARLASDGSLDVGALTRMKVRDFRLHLEFSTPYMPRARGQGRGNSGVYIQRRYEVQILDSFGLPAEANECGGIYRQHPPDINMCFPPLSWQTYDVDFRAARWDRCGNKIADARITVLHNGVPIHSHYPIADKTGAGQPERPEAMPILFQNHGNPVHFRNIWIQPQQPPSRAVAGSGCSRNTHRWKFRRLCRWRFRPR